MPPGRRQQTNTMLYTLVTFVALFIVSTVAAVICYVKYEEQNKFTIEAEQNLQEVMNPAEQRKTLEKIVGAVPRGKSGMGQMTDYLDEMVVAIMAGPLEDAPAQSKVEAVNRRKLEMFESLLEDYLIADSIDPNETGLLQVVEKLKALIDNSKNTILSMEEQLDTLHENYDDAVIVHTETKQRLLKEKEKYQQQVETVLTDYKDFKMMIEGISQQEIETLTAKLDENVSNAKQLNQNLLKTQAELQIAEKRVKHTQNKLEAIIPAPDSDIAAFQQDGEILLIDDFSKVVYISLGTDDHITSGLTFSVYDKHVPIPRDGKGKAEIEVFKVEKNISTARIVKSKRSRPILEGDLIANLIWQRDKTNIFAVIGDFDLNDDDYPDFDGLDKIRDLITSWGGTVTSIVTIETDFVVLGTAPRPRKKPTFEDMELDPEAMGKYEKSMEINKRYSEMFKRAETMSVPIFSLERFLYFIGYSTQSETAGAYSF